MPIMYLEYYMKRGEVNMDDIADVDQNNIYEVVKLIEDKKFDEAVARMPKMFFEWIPSNGDADCSEVFDLTDDFKLDLNQDNSTVRVGLTNGNLLLTISVKFPMKVKNGISAEDLSSWIDDNSMYFCGYVGAGWSYHSDDGCTLSVLTE